MKALVIVLAIIVVVIIIGVGIFYYADVAGNRQTIIYQRDNSGQSSSSVQSYSATTSAVADAAQIIGTSSEPQNIVTTAGQFDTYKIFVAALMQAEMQDSLQGPGPYTVFAPTNKAFGQLDSTTTQKLVNDKQFLVQLLRNHIVKGNYLYSNFVNGGKLTNLNGGQLKISSTTGVVTIGGAKIIDSDLISSNGVIQGVDKVIISQ